MKKFLIVLFCCCFGFSVCFARVVINKPIRVEADPSQDVAHIVLEFAEKFIDPKDDGYAVPEEDSGRFDVLSLYFTGMKKDDFKKLNVESTIKAVPFVRKVLIDKEPGKPRVFIKIFFPKGLVSWKVTRMNSPNYKYISINIYRSELLSKIVNMPHSGFCKNNIFPGGWRGKLISCGKKKKLRSIDRKKINIVIDAGHGGRDSGSYSFGLKEKKITLDIARKAASRLRKFGYNVFLTRNSDRYLSVVDRFKLAQQLKADLFVSVHVNASAGTNSVAGLETHFLDGSPFLDKNRSCKVYGIDKGKDLYLRNLLRDKINASKVLSHSIQNSLLNLFSKKRINVVNRGVKKTVFRTLMRSRVPSSIVEVGFLTNKKEAKRLSTPFYRGCLAKGISDGIMRFLS